MSPHKRCKIKFTKSEYWVNISTRGLVIFGKNAGAAVLPSLACKSTACWPQDEPERPSMEREVLR